MKFSALTLFLILLLILVISVLFCRCYNYEEGFISYQSDKESLSKILLPIYSDDDDHILTKLYDNLYFDQRNGNLIELDGESGDAVNAVNNTVSVSKLHVTPRNGTSTSSFIVNDETGMTTAPKSTLDNSYSSYIYTSKCENTDKYVVCVMPWRSDTYIHIINLTEDNPSNLISFSFTYNNIATSFDAFSAGENTVSGSKTNSVTDTDGTTSDTSENIVSEYKSDNHADNNKMVIEPLYDSKKKVYQLAKNVKYDITSSNLIVLSKDSDSKTELTVYKRNGEIVTIQSSSSSSSSNVSFNDTHGTASIANESFLTRVFYDEEGQNTILYMPNAKKTLVALLCFDSDNKTDLRNVARFNSEDIEVADPTFSTKDDDDDDDDSDDDSDDDKDKDKEGDYGSEFWKNYTSGSSLFGVGSDKFMLKSQIVPPVCPACPSCSGGACGSCGGKGGCGSNDKDGKSLVDGNGIRDVISESSQIVGHTFDSAGNILTGIVNTTGNVAGQTFNTTGNVIGGAVGATGNVAGQTFDAAGNVIGGAVGATGEIAGKTVDAAGNVINSAFGATGNAVGGAFDAAGNVVGGAVGAVGNVLGSTVDAATGLVPNGGQNGGQNDIILKQNRNGRAADEFTYTGQLKDRETTEFMPRTADFSSFGR